MKRLYLLRADHLLKDFCKEKLDRDLSITSEKVEELRHVLAVLDDLSAEELGAKIGEYGITAPDAKNPLSSPYPFNLMFQTSIGPSGLSPGFMRPETAQGIFVNFKDLYYYNGNKLPFAGAQIGQAFRNEISPRQGLLRVCEFTLAEIEHFVYPDDKTHPKFSDVENLEFLCSPGETKYLGNQQGEYALVKQFQMASSIMKHSAISLEGCIFSLSILALIMSTYVFGSTWRMRLPTMLQTAGMLRLNVPMAGLSVLVLQIGLPMIWELTQTNAELSLWRMKNLQNLEKSRKLLLPQ